MPGMNLLIMIEEIRVPSEDLAIAFAIKNSTHILSLLMLISMVAVKIIFAAALRRAIWFRTGKLTGLLRNMAAGMQLVRSSSPWRN